MYHIVNSELKNNRTRGTAFSLPLLDYWHSSSTLFLSVFIIWPTKAKWHSYIHKKMIYDQVMGRPGDILYLPGSRRDKKWLNKAAVFPNTRKWNFLKELGVGEGSVSNTVWEGVPLDDASFHYIYYMCICIATAILIMRISKYSYDLIVTNILWCTVFNIIIFHYISFKVWFLAWNILKASSCYKSYSSQIPF